MSDEKIRAALVRHWSTIENQDVAHEIYRDDVVVEFPQSGERFLGLSHLRAMREAYPANVSAKILQSRGSGELWVTELVITYDGKRSVLSADPLAVSSTCKQRGAAARPFVRTELFFGARKPDGSEVSRAEWVAFLDKVITPAFPDGLTVLTGTGRFRGSDGVAIEEKGMVLILLYPHAKRKNSGARIEKIRMAYKRDFLQESVLRVDDPVPVCVSL